MRIRINPLSFLLALASSCAAPNPWIIDSIAAGNISFDSSRLRYSSPQKFSNITFEMFRMGDQIEAFINLNRPLLEENVRVLFTMNGESFEETIDAHEGRMRLRLSPETAQKVIAGLQDGEKVAICVDGYEETLDPSRFASSFAQFLGKTNFLQNIIKVPL